MTGIYTDAPKSMHSHGLSCPIGCPEGSACLLWMSIQRVISVTKATVSCRKLDPTVDKTPVVNPSNCARACSHQAISGTSIVRAYFTRLQSTVRDPEQQGWAKSGKHKSSAGSD